MNPTRIDWTWSSFFVFCGLIFKVFPLKLFAVNKKTLGHIHADTNSVAHAHPHPHPLRHSHSLERLQIFNLNRKLSNLFFIFCLCRLVCSSAVICFVLCPLLTFEKLKKHVFAAHRSEIETFLSTQST